MLCYRLGSSGKTHEGAGSVVFAVRFSLLIADDDAAFRTTLREIFEPRGFRTLLAADGREALEILDRTAIDCLLFDVNMPNLSGVEALRIVRARNNHLPCIIMTAEPSRNVLDQASSLAVFSILKKPVSKDQVTATVQQALGRAS